MAKCVRCGAATELYVNEVPICVSCAEIKKPKKTPPKVTPPPRHARSKANSIWEPPGSRDLRRCSQRRATLSELVRHCA
jgi:hypothetical protein